MSEMVTNADIAQAQAEVPARAAAIAARRAEAERQHAEVADIQRRAVRTSVSGRAFDLGNGNLVHIVNGPSPLDGSILCMMAVLPIIEWDVEDFHGGWAS